MYYIKVWYDNEDNYWITQVLDENEQQVQASYSSEIQDRDEDIKIYKEVFEVGEVDGINL